jgi:transcriptional regulator
VTIQRTSDEDLLIDHGSLYPALQRLERQRLIKSKWGTSDLNRRARFYELTRAGRKKLTAETGKWKRMVRAIGRVLQHQLLDGRSDCTASSHVQRPNQSRHPVQPSRRTVV